MRGALLRAVWSLAPVALVIALVIVGLAAVRPAHAQFARPGALEEQTVTQQLEIADIGDTVEIIFLNRRDRRDRPAGVILRQNPESIQLRTPSGRTKTFHRRFVYAITLLKKGKPAQAAPSQPEPLTPLAQPGRPDQPGPAKQPESEQPEPKLEQPQPQPEEAPAEQPRPSEAPALGMDDPTTSQIDGMVPDASRARLLFAPTARTQKPGQVYLANHELFFPYMAVGISNVLDMRAGISVTPNTVQFMYGGAKVGVLQGDRFNLAVGGFGVATTNVITVTEGKNEYGGVAYVMSTIGTPDKALTVGAGYLAAGGIIEEKALAMMGGELRLGDSNVKLLSENYLLYGSGEEENSKELFGGQLFGGGVSGILSMSARIIRPRSSVDLGVMTSNSWWDASIPAIPFITFSYHLTSIY